MKNKRTALCTAFLCCLLTTTPAWCGDNGNGTVTVNGLAWLKDGSCMGKMAWSSATSAAQALSAANAPAACNLKDGSTAGRWRLPTFAELSGVSGSSSGQFSNVQYAKYWSSSASTLSGYYAVINMQTATVGASSGSTPNYFLVVRNP